MNSLSVANHLLKIAHELLAGSSEKEVERFLKAYLKGTPWERKVFSVGGYNP